MDHPLGMFGGVNRAADALGEAPRVPTRGPLPSINSPRGRGAPHSSNQDSDPRIHNPNDPAYLLQHSQAYTRRSSFSRRLPLVRARPALGRPRGDLSHHQDLQTHTMADWNYYTRPVGAETFLKSLKPLSIMDVPENNRDCPICLEPYQNSRHGEPPVRLPCRHVIGNDCLQRWVRSDSHNHNNNACPYVRHLLIFLPLLLFIPAD